MINQRSVILRSRCTEPEKTRNHQEEMLSTLTDKRMKQAYTLSSYTRNTEGKSRSNRTSSDCACKNEVGGGRGAGSPYLNHKRTAVKQIEAKEISLKLRDVREVVQKQRTN